MIDLNIHLTMLSLCLNIFFRPGQLLKFIYFLFFFLFLHLYVMMKCTLTHIERQIREKKWVQAYLNHYVKNHVLVIKLFFEGTNFHGLQKLSISLIHDFVDLQKSAYNIIEINVMSSTFKLWFPFTKKKTQRKLVSEQIILIHSNWLLTHPVHSSL